MPVVAEPLKVFAAASLTDALDEALALCDPEAIGIYAGSGTAARQIAQGAPADLYISANPQWMDWLAARGMIVEETRTDMLGNRLVIVSGASDAGILEGGRIAVADTETVPSGLYAHQALEARGWWDDMKHRLVLSSNVRETLTWVIRGEAPFGIVYETDALAEPRVEILLAFDQTDHDPIRYPAAVVSDADTHESRSLLACLQDEKASKIFADYGFSLPE